MSLAVPPARRLRAGLAFVLAAAACLLTGLALAVPASAHALLVRSNPSDGATLTAAPGTLQLWFSEGVQLDQTRLKVTGGSGLAVSIGAVHRLEGAATGAPAGLAWDPTSRPIAAGETALEIDLPPLAPDVYRLSWQTLSSDDLHITSGIVTFGVQRTVAAGGARAADPAPDLWEALSRWVGSAGLALAAGALALAPVLRGAGSAAGRRRLRLVSVGGAAAAVTGGLASLLLQVHQAGGGTTVATVLSGGYGPRWLLRELAAVVLLGLLLVPGGRRDRVRGAGTATAVAAVCASAAGIALTGHGVSGPAALLRLAVAGLHVAAGLTWAGGVLALAVALPGQSELRHSLLARFGRLAASCLATVTVTGLLLTSYGVASLDALLFSTYGRLLALKLALLAAALTVTVLAVRPRRGRVNRRVRAGLAGEAALLACVLGAAGLLASSAPAIGPAWAQVSAAQPIRTATIGDLTVALKVSPNRPGRNFVSADVEDARRPVIAPVTAVAFELTAPGAAAPVTVAARPDVAHRWMVVTDDVARPGAWRVRVVVTRPSLPDTRTSFDWVVADPASRLGRTVVSSRPWVTALDALAVLVTLGALATVVAGRWRRRRSGWSDDAGGPGARGAETVAQQLASGTDPGEDRMAAAGSGRPR